MKERTCLLIEYTSDSLPPLPRPSRVTPYLAVFLLLYRVPLPRPSSPRPFSSRASPPAADSVCTRVQSVLFQLLPLPPARTISPSRSSWYPLLTPPFPSPPNRLRVYPSSSSAVSKLFFLSSPSLPPTSPRLRRRSPRAAQHPPSVFAVPPYGLALCLSGRAKIVVPFLPPWFVRVPIRLFPRSPRANEPRASTLAAPAPPEHPHPRSPSRPVPFAGAQTREQDRGSLREGSSSRFPSGNAVRMRETPPGMP